MPVVVNELVFKAEIATPTNGRQSESNSTQRPPTDRKEIVEACVEQVMRILDRKKER